MLTPRQQILIAMMTCATAVAASPLLFAGHGLATTAPNAVPVVTVAASPAAPMMTPSATPLPPAAVATPVAASASFIRHDIAPHTVDANAVQGPNSRTGVPNNHLVLVPTAPADRKGRLFLFIGGTTSSELITQEIMRDGVGRGYHSIAIAYPNEQAVGPLCLGSTDDQCSAKVREETLTGVDLTPLVTVAPADAIEPRLVKLLVYLQATYPNEGWDGFLRQGQVDWSKISTVGHSQGAGHAAYLAKRHAMFRSVMISGVADITAAGQPAPWLFRPNLTPVDRQYGFSHLADYVVTIELANASWNAIGLKPLGPIVQTDGRAGNYGGSHKLTTALKPASGANPHVSMVEDASMPRNPDGTPAFKPVWEYMAFP